MARRTASKASLRIYEKGADRLLVASDRLHAARCPCAHPTHRLDSLVEYLRDRSLLRPGTISVYYQQANMAIDRLAVLGAQPDGVTSARAALRSILKDRKGVSKPARGPSRKHKDPSLGELKDVYLHLFEKYRTSRDPIDLILFLYMSVMPRIGLRPVELGWAFWSGTSLYTRTAKRVGRPIRYVPTEKWPPVFKSALGLLIKVMPKGLTEDEYDAFHGLLASRLARASKWTRTRKRLSLSCTRHIAIATWKKLGLTPELIAELAGHAGLRSQSFYAGGKSGYGGRFIFLTAEEGNALRSSAGDNELAKTDFEVDDFPIPPPAPQTIKDEALWPNFRDRRDAEIDGLKQWMENNGKTKRKKDQTADPIPGSRKI